MQDGDETMGVRLAVALGAVCQTRRPEGGG